MLTTRAALLALALVTARGRWLGIHSHGHGGPMSRSEMRQASPEEPEHDALADIEAVKRESFCAKNTYLQWARVDIPDTDSAQVRDKALLAAKLLAPQVDSVNKSTLRHFVQQIFGSDNAIFCVKVLVANKTKERGGHRTNLGEKDKIIGNIVLVDSQARHNNLEVTEPDLFVRVSPWPNVTEHYLRKKPMPWPQHSNPDQPPKPYAVQDTWTLPYFSCEYRKWVVSHLSFVMTKYRVAVLGVDLDVSDIDIDQCDPELRPHPQTTATLVTFQSTHKCHNETSECEFTPRKGWVRGAYVCRCREGFYPNASIGPQPYRGSIVEDAFRFSNNTNGFRCLPCAPGCTTCIDATPCLSHYHWPFRITLLAISVMCILMTLVLAAYVYKFRRVKVIKAASPVFLCITLLGCAIMYCEMAAIFPVLDRSCCVATKWTRHMGFCITYSALLLKTWRVSLTYRVKSAHKLKLTDHQLLHWLFPILLEVAIFLGTWTISSPPEGVYIKDWSGLKFKICEYNWWDHTIALGELLFLLWGIRVCYSVRHAQSLFNEARHISVAIYNIALVNTVMMLFHLVLLPDAGPDIKYLFGFIRTQLSTSTTVALVFGPKFYRLLRGEGDSWDTSHSRTRGVSLNGITTGLSHEETQIDPYQENEELKEEVQRLAAQIEMMKIAHMEHNNRHLKTSAAKGIFGTSPGPAVVKAMYMKLESADSPGSRVSPAAELVSERV
ncbi:probable G-protein coupled receptor CG31760 isoform X2 [Varroa destructor]|uniref:G-protein coupled receptors family 3 profile domain-containing protein n=1 Tax=Varroa destructor TaxID=109461 RepID=A0A7M7KWE6_VARDE|nr:probable G-protein coupled receptor CG31760 isoform X2 [Varroa destructor]